MPLDWFTVGAQAANFAILVWLMKRFLYKPILAAIHAREKRIAAELKEAADKKAEAGKERDAFKQKNDAWEAQRAALMKTATDAAAAEGARLLEEARQAADALSSKRQETLRTEETDLHDSIRRRTQQEVFAVARKALSDLAGAGLEPRVAEVFTRRIREIDGDVKAGLAASFKKQAGPALIRGAFDLPPDGQAQIQKAINETFSADVSLRFETAPDLIGGIELTVDGQKVAWSIADYLTSLEKTVNA